MVSQGRRSYAGVAGVLLASALVLAACGGGGEDPEATGGGPEQLTGGGQSADGFEATTFDVGQTFWHSGFQVALGEARTEVATNALTDAKRYQLTIAGTFTNLGDDSGFFGPDMAIMQGSTNYTSSILGGLSDVGGGLTAEGDLVFVVDEGFDQETAKLVVGSADEARAEVPLGPAAGDLVALEPEDVGVAGTVSVALVDLNITEGELRYDNPDRHTQVDAGKQALTLRFDAVSRKSGNWQLFDSYFALTDPDGVSVGVSSSELGSLPGNATGLTTEDLYVQFLVDAQPSGDYTLVFRPADYWTEDGPIEDTLTISLG